MNVRLMGVKARRLMEKRGKSFPSAGGVKHVNPLPTCDTKECVLKVDVYHWKALYMRPLDSLPRTSRSPLASVMDDCMLTAMCMMQI